MKQSNYTVIIIEPSEGHTLTQAADVEVLNRVLSKKIYLAVNDSPSNWKEITDEEAALIKAEQERLIEEQRLLEEEEAKRLAEENEQNNE